MAQREPKPPYRPERRELPEEVESGEGVPVERVERVERIRPLRSEEVHPYSVRERPRPLARLRHAVDYIFYVVYGLLLIRLVLAMLGAREDAAFTRLIHTLTGPLYAPFDQIVSSPRMDGGYIDFPIIVAILAYALLHIAIRGLIRVVEGRSPGR